jgi:AcrR family transcriptional regulator
MVNAMSRDRLDNLDPKRQQKLFDIAAEEFSAKGYDAASLNRIITRSGMSKSSLYYYFDDKADLFTTLLERSIAFLFKEIGGFDPSMLTADTYWSEFETLYRRAVVMMNKNTWYVKLGRMFYRLRGDQHPATGRVFDASRRWVGIILAKGQELGVIRTDLAPSLIIDCTMGLLEAIDRWCVAHWDEFDDAQRLNMVGEHIGLLRALLAPRDSH